MFTTLAINSTYIASLHAHEAARLIRESYPNAASAVFYAPGAYRESATLFNVFDADGADIWARSDEHSDQLHRCDVVERRLGDATRLERWMFPAAYRAGDALRLDITAALQPPADAGADGLAALIESMHLPHIVLGVLLHDVAAKKAWTQDNGAALEDLSDAAANEPLRATADRAASVATVHGTQAQAAYLIEHLDEGDARRRVFDLAADYQD